jgi:hypothetical protein
VDLRSNSQRGKGEVASPAIRVSAIRDREVVAGDAPMVSGADGRVDGGQCGEVISRAWSVLLFASGGEGEGWLEELGRRWLWSPINASICCGIGQKKSISGVCWKMGSRGETNRGGGLTCKRQNQAETTTDAVSSAERFRQANGETKRGKEREAVRGSGDIYGGLNLQRGLVYWAREVHRAARGDAVLSQVSWPKLGDDLTGGPHM